MQGSGSKTKRLHVEKLSGRFLYQWGQRWECPAMRTKVRVSSSWGRRWECPANAESQRNIEQQGQENLPLKWYQLWKQTFAGWEAFSHQGQPKKLCGGLITNLLCGGWRITVTNSVMSYSQIITKPWQRVKTSVARQNQEARENSQLHVEHSHHHLDEWQWL